MIITVTKSAYVHRRIFSLLCMLLIFIAILPISAFADWVTVSTVNSASYFQTFSSKGVWTAIGTPAHYINETGQVAYCLQTNYNSPNNSGYSSTSGSITMRLPSAVCNPSSSTAIRTTTVASRQMRRDTPLPMPYASGSQNVVRRAYRIG